MNSNCIITDGDGRIALHDAVIQNHMNAVTKLLGYEVVRREVDTPDRHARTALHWAALGDRDDMLKKILNSGADVRRSSKDGKTALRVALDRGTETTKRTLVLAWVMKGGKKELIEELIRERRIRYNTDYGNGATLLHHATKAGHGALVELLLKTPDFADVNTRDHDYCTPLALAASNGYGAIAKMLIDAGANIEGGHLDYSPPAFTIGNGHYCSDMRPVERRAGVNVKRSSVWTPLARASFNCHEAVAKLLIEKGAATNSKDDKGQTPLMQAVQQGRESIVKLLLDHGAQVNERNNGKWTELSWAAEKGHGAIAKLLVESGADVEAKNRKGWTPLATAAFRGHVAVAGMLVKKGANVNAIMAAVARDGNAAAV